MMLNTTWRNLFAREFFSRFHAEREKASRAKRGGRYAEWYAEFYGDRHRSFVEGRVLSIVRGVVTASGAAEDLAGPIARAVAAHYVDTSTESVSEYLGDNNLKSHQKLADRRVSFGPCPAYG